MVGNWRHRSLLLIHSNNTLLTLLSQIHSIRLQPRKLEAITLENQDLCHISRVKIDQIKVVNILIISEEFAYGEAPFDGACLHAELLPNRQ